MIYCKNFLGKPKLLEKIDEKLRTSFKKARQANKQHASSKRNLLKCFPGINFYIKGHVSMLVS